MFHAIVIGRVVSTRKHASLDGLKLMMVRRLDCNWKEIKDSETIIAADPIGAGVGEWVLVSTGSSARRAANTENSVVDAAIVGILDPNEQG